MKVITSLSDITSDWLEEVLRLGKKAIRGFGLKELEGLPVSSAAIISLDYFDNRGNFPDSLFIKIPNANTLANLPGYGEREAAFYETSKNRSYSRFIPECRFAAFDSESNSYNIILDDISTTHFQTRYPVPPGLKYCISSVEALAEIHSAWWNAPSLEKIAGNKPSVSENDEYLKSLEEMTFRFADFMGDRLSECRKDILFRSLEKLSHIFRKNTENDRFTLVHGDAHAWNFMYPNDDSSDVKIIDWQSFETGIAASDIAYFVALHWFPERRKRFEKLLLEKYFETLKEKGIDRYSFEDLFDDYRNSVIQLLFVPVYQWNVELTPGIWYNHLERIFDAYDDLGCAEMHR